MLIRVMGLFSVLSVMFYMFITFFRQIDKKAWTFAFKTAVKIAFSCVLAGLFISVLNVVSQLTN